MPKEGEIAEKIAKKAIKAATGDVYVRKWSTTRVKGKGKKKQAITTEHELHLNPVTLAVGGAFTALTVGGALWLMQMNVQPKAGVMVNVTVRRIVTKQGSKNTPEQGQLIATYGTHTAKGTYSMEVSSPTLKQFGMLQWKAIQEYEPEKLKEIARHGWHDEAASVAFRLMQKVKPYDWHYEGTGVITPNTIVFKYSSRTKKRIGLSERKGFSIGSPSVL